MATSYNPRVGTLADHVCAWFRTNPDEELSTADIGVKFGVPTREVVGKLAPAVEHGLLSRVNGAQHWVYRAGPVLVRLAERGGAC